MSTYVSELRVTRKFPFSVQQRSCNGNFAFRFCARFILHISVFIFSCVDKIILRMCNSEKMVKRTLYARKAGAVLLSKELRTYPSVKTQMVFSDYAKHRILVLRRRGNYPPTISRLPRSDGIRASRRGIFLSFC